MKKRKITIEIPEDLRIGQWLSNFFGLASIYYDLNYIKDSHIKELIETYNNLYEKNIKISMTDVKIEFKGKTLCSKKTTSK